ncbi:MAG: zinc-binding dehydrogenase [Christensenellaceae bacterium]
MKTKAVRLYGKSDLRLEEFELPEITDDEILARVISDSLCMSSYKAAIQGSDHKRVPNDVAQNPVIIGHEFCGEVVKVGKNNAHLAAAGDKFTVQPAMFYQNTLDSPGYSFPYYGGDATYIIIPRQVFIMNCFLKYESDAFYYGSLAEPMSCILGGFHTNYHTKLGSYVHDMGIVKDGKMAILAGVGPMGLGTIDFALHCDRRPKLLVVTDIDQVRIDRAKSIFSEEYAAKIGIELHYVNTSQKDEAYVIGLTGGTGFDDVFVLAPVKPVVEMGDRLLGTDGCLNFFAGPTNPQFAAEFNFYNVHYSSTHICGNTGGNTDDMREALAMMSAGKINPSVMITHVGGLNCVAEVTLALHDIPGGKKLIYNQIDLPLTAIDDFEELGKTNPMFAQLAEIVKKSKGLWSAEAEKFLLANAKSIN